MVYVWYRLLRRAIRFSVPRSAVNAALRTFLDDIRKCYSRRPLARREPKPRACPAEIAL